MPIPKARYYRANGCGPVEEDEYLFDCDDCLPDCARSLPSAFLCVKHAIEQGWIW
jgi:hypothetical protein